MDNTSSEEKAAHYDRFFGPLYFEPYALDVAGRLANHPLSMVVELAAGTGRATRHIRDKIPASAKLIASDIDEEMLAIAKSKLAHMAIDWQIIDAQQLPFGDNSTDLLVCCFGYMFVPDKPKAFAEACRVLKPGGMLLFTTWDKLEHNGASYIARSLAQEYLEEPLPASYDLATSMHDEGEIKVLLDNAGFTEISIERVQHLAVFPTAKAAAEGLASGAVYEYLQKQHPARIAEIKSRLENQLTEKYGSAPMIAPISAMVIQARKISRPFV